MKFLFPISCFHDRAMTKREASQSYRRNGKTIIYDIVLYQDLTRYIKFNIG